METYTYFCSNSGCKQERQFIFIDTKRVADESSNKIVIVVVVKCLSCQEVQEKQTTIN